MTRSSFNKASAELRAAALERLIRTRGNYEHVLVRPRSGHFLVKVLASDGTSQLVARATRIGADEYGLSFRTHTGRWESTPVCGSLEAIAEGLTGPLSAYLDAGNL
ncbi:MAG TPA: hypothetical protein VFS30_08215 [Dehalococcoidia bacterium]|nr:hypothetical protein [Dehalococcoidia bacterium]